MPRCGTVGLLSLKFLVICYVWKRKTYFFIKYYLKFFCKSWGHSSPSRLEVCADLELATQTTMVWYRFLLLSWESCHYEEFKCDLIKLINQALSNLWQLSHWDWFGWGIYQQIYPMSTCPLWFLLDQSLNLTYE